MIITVESTIHEIDSDFKVKAECKVIRKGNGPYKGELCLCVKIKPDQVKLLGFPWYVVRAVTHPDGYVYMPVSTAHTQILFW